MSGNPDFFSEDQIAEIERRLIDRNKEASVPSALVPVTARALAKACRCELHAAEYALEKIGPLFRHGEPGESSPFLADGEPGTIADEAGRLWVWGGGKCEYGTVLVTNDQAEAAGKHGWRVKGRRSGLIEVQRSVQRDVESEAAAGLL